MNLQVADLQQGTRTPAGVHTHDRGRQGRSDRAGTLGRAEMAADAMALRHLRPVGGLGMAAIERMIAAVGKAAALELARERRNVAGDDISSAPRLPVVGNAANSFLEYGCCGARKKASRAATSTICPAYMTATRCAIPATTPRSCVMSRIDIPRSRLERAQQIEHLRLDRHVERGGRLVGNQQLRLAGERERDHHPLLHSAGELERVLVDPPRAVGDADRVEQLDRARPRGRAARTGMARGALRRSAGRR